MRIALVNDTIYPYSKGGAQKRIWEIARRLAERGHRVHLFGMKYWDGQDIITKDGVYLHGVCKPQQLYVEGRRSIKQAVYFAYKLTRPLLREDLDIIDCSNFPYFPCFSAKLHSMTRGSTLIITWLEVWDEYWLEYLGKRGIIGRLVERLTAHLSRNVISISETTKRGLLSIGARGDIAVMPNGVDFAEIASVSPADDHSDIIFAGRLIKDKNIDVLIRTVGLISRDNPRVDCLIIGDGPEKGSLERLARDLKLESNVHFAGFLQSSEEVFSHMKSSKVFVFPSTREGFGIAAVEANACGLPVVTIDHPRNAATEVVIDGENGFLCELSQKDIAEKTLLALDRRQHMEGKCMEFSMQYDWDRIADLAESIYKEITA